MTGKILIDPISLKNQSERMLRLKNEYDSLFQEVTGLLRETNNNWSDVLSNNFYGKIISAQKSFSGIVTLLDNGAAAAANSAATFQSVDSQLSKAMASGNSADKGGGGSSGGAGSLRSFDSDNDEEAKSFWERFKDNFKYDFKICDAAKLVLYGVAGLSFAGDLLNGNMTGKKTADFVKKLPKMLNLIYKTGKDIKNYQKIGRAIGTKKAASYWLKKVTGFSKKDGWLGDVNNMKSLVKSGRMTRAASVAGGFKGGFVSQLKEGMEKVKTPKGAAFAGIGFLADGAFNWFDNKEEQEKSNGKMSDERVIAETVSETIVGAGLKFIGTAAVGAAVAAVSPFALPAVGVSAISGLVIAGADAGVKAVTGASITENVSDFILDSGEKIIEKVGEKAKQVKGRATPIFAKSLLLI